MSFRAKDEKSSEPFKNALAVASVDSKKDAFALAVLVCRMSYDGRPVITERSGFQAHDVDSLFDSVGPYLESTYRAMKKRRKVVR